MDQELLDILDREAACEDMELVLLVLRGARVTC